MRVTMYAEDYEPIVVLDVGERDLDVLRRGQGDHIRVIPRVPMPLNLRAQDVVGQTCACSVLLAVEGMRFARRVAPMLVARGLRLTPDMVAPGSNLMDLAQEILHSALAAARRRADPDGEQRRRREDERMAMQRMLMEPPRRVDPGTMSMLNSAASWPRSSRPTLDAALRDQGWTPQWPGLDRLAEVEARLDHEARTSTELTHGNPED
jgi:hypothetical protein